MRVKVSYRWHLRQLMAARGMFATSDLVPLLASRGVKLSREQVYRLVARTPERLSLATLAALCDILEVSPGELIEPVRDTPVKAARNKTAAEETAAMGSVSDLRPRRARVAVAQQ
jgi:DNA-binding Xre family transcriptional regulator